MYAFGKIFMKVVFEEVTASTASMAVEDSKEVSSYSIFFDVKSDTDSFFIVVSSNAWMGVDAKGLNSLVSFVWSFGRFNVR